MSKLSHRPPDSTYLHRVHEYCAFTAHLRRCNGGVRFALNTDTHARLRFAALQSDTGRRLLQRCGRRPDDITSIVLVEQDRCSIKSEAILRIARLLEQPFPVVAALLFPLPGIVRDAFYDQVSQKSHSA